MSAAKLAEAARLEGNEAMRQKAYNAAFNSYSVALRHMPRDHLVLANRSQAALKLQHYSLALRDAENAINHGPAAWHKGHYRKAMAEFETENFSEAALSFSAAAQRAPDDTIRNDALAFVARAQAGADGQMASEQFRPLIGTTVGVLLGLLLLSADLYSGNVARGTGKGSLSAVDFTTASLAMGLFMSVAGGAIGYASGYGWNMWKSTKRFERLHKVTAVVDETTATTSAAPSGGEDPGSSDMPETLGGSTNGPSTRKGAGKPRGRKRTTAREAALKAAAAAKRLGLDKLPTS